MGVGGWGAVGHRAMSFPMFVFFPLPLKKLLNSYLLGLGRKGQKPRIGKKYGFFPPNKKNMQWGQSEVPENFILSVEA